MRAMCRPSTIRSSGLTWSGYSRIRTNRGKISMKRALPRSPRASASTACYSRLVVSRTDVEKPEGGLESVYELIAGERRLRASRIAGLKQIPVVIRQGESNLTKLELAIIENLQREDLNAIDRAKALRILSKNLASLMPRLPQK